MTRPGLAMSTQTGSTVAEVSGPSLESRPGWGLDLAGWWFLGLPPEDAGGVAVEFGEEVLDAL